jgi:DNA polymerase-3 subunit delta'
MLVSPAAAQELWGHEQAEQTLLSLALSGRMPHGWIFTGPAGIGKATLAFRFARFLLYRGFGGAAHSQSNSLDLFAEVPHSVAAPRDLSIPPEAPVFTQVAAGSHPDLLVITPEDDNKDLNVEKIRAVAPFLSMTAAQSGWRMVIIDGAERMNRAAQNALLKVLEEPSPNSVIILLTDHLGKLLPTIRSRSRLLRLNADHNQSPETLAKMDPRIADLTTDSQNTLWQMAGEAPGQLLQLLDQDALQALEHLRDYIRAPSAQRANELAQGFTYQPQFGVAGRVLLWLCHQIATGHDMGLPSVRIPALLKFHEDAQSMLAETTQLHLDGAACWHELLGRLTPLFEKP